MSRSSEYTLDAIPDRLLPLTAAAEATCTPVATWRHWIARHRCPLPVVHVGSLVRVRASDLARLVAGEISTPPRRRRGRPTKAEVIARQRAETEAAARAAQDTAADPSPET